MSFHIRKINKERILKAYEYKSINGVIDLFSNSDALTLYDEESSYIHGILMSSRDLSEKESEIQKYINKINIL